MSKRDSAVIARGAEAATENEEETAREREREREREGWRVAAAAAAVRGGQQIAGSAIGRSN